MTDSDGSKKLVNMKFNLAEKTKCETIQNRNIFAGLDQTHNFFVSYHKEISLYIASQAKSPPC